MAIVVACGVLLLLGLGLTVRWGRMDHVAAPGPGAAGLAAEALPPGQVASRLLREVALGSAAGAAAGLLVLGPGNRLVMRLLALTSPQARGRITEAGEVVGDIDLGGTVSLLVFAGLFAGVLVGIVWIGLRRLLPAGPAGGALLGALLLVLLGTRAEPLRADNVDFDLVGPGWLSVLTFGALALVSGAAVAAFAARLSRSLPLPSTRPRVMAAYALALLPLLPLAPVLVPLLVLGALLVLASRSRRLRDLSRSPRLLTGARLALLAGGLAALPTTVSALTDIVGRG